MKSDLIMIFLFLSFILINAESIDLTFPDNFMIGVGSSAVQIEGAWNFGDKGEGIWDNLASKKPNLTADKSNADVAADSFHKYKEDVKILKYLRVNHYRFSLSWQRILPTGRTDKISKIGIKYYHDLLNELSKYNITPVVTLSHFDHPQILENQGGWLNESTAFAFKDYARLVFREFGPKVKYFVTFNEVFIMCQMMYVKGLFTTGVEDQRFKPYICAHNILKAHAMAYRVYDSEFRKKQRGSIGMNEAFIAYYNKYENETNAKDNLFDFTTNWILNPIYKGNYPKYMIERIGNLSRREGLKVSRLPIFSDYWINYIRGTSDFVGVNHYTSYMVEKTKPNENSWYMAADSGTTISLNVSWPKTNVPFSTINPKGFGDTLRLIKKKYNNPPILVLENGIAVDGPNDIEREKFLHSYLKDMLLAIKRDKCNVKMYTHWSLLDGFEWVDGYKIRFGLVQVDQKDPNRKRTLKRSAHWYKCICESRQLQEPGSCKLHS